MKEKPLMSMQALPLHVYRGERENFYFIRGGPLNLSIFEDVYLVFLHWTIITE